MHLTLQCIAMLFEVYGGEAMKKSSVFEWHTWFKDGHSDMEDVEITNDSVHLFLPSQGYCLL
jgi:hypothetical protein